MLFQQDTCDNTIFGLAPTQLQSIDCMCVKVMKLFAHKIMLSFYYLDAFATSEAAACLLSNGL